MKRKLDLSYIRYYISWILQGSPIPMPHPLKIMRIKKIARKYGHHVFIETGTYKGQMIDGVVQTFDSIYSIEIGNALALNAREKFKSYPHVKIIHGDSSVKLRELLLKIDSSCIFWLDGHYSEGDTAKGKLNTPILDELSAIFKHHIKNHVVLIDDARCFTGENDYPTIDKLKTIISNYPNYQLEVNNDVVEMLPK